MNERNKHKAAAVFVALLLGAGAQAAIGQHAEDRHPGGGAAPGGRPSAGHPPAGVPNQHLDSRFSHNHYYFDRGYSLHRPPPGGRELHGHDGDRYRFQGGNWYRWRSGAWIVWGAPIGMFVPVLPPYYTTVWWRGVPYYYANDTYYLWDDDQDKYEVVAPPDGIEASGSTQPPPSGQLFVYPKTGQSPQQQDLDRYECHSWAVSKSGFDPTLSGGGVAPETAVEKRNDYFRAEVACLEGRGYSVK